MDKNAISNLCKLVSGVIRTGKRGKLSTTEIVLLTSVGSASKPVDMFWLERVSGVSYTLHVMMTGKKREEVPND